MTMAWFRELDANEVAELQAFAKEEGKRWKHILAYGYWYKGLPVRGYPALYGLRNSHGPTWLESFKLPKD